MDSDGGITIEINDEREEKGKTKSQRVYAASSISENPVVTPFQLPHTRTVQNYVIVWLDNIFDEVNNADCIKPITQLREVVNTIHTFTDVDDCIDFISDTEDEKIFMISSGVFGQTIVPVIHHLQQLHSVYIFSEHTIEHEQWADEWSKVKGIYTNIALICEALKQATEICDQNSVSISFIKITDRIGNKNLDELDHSFMFIHILKDILPNIDFDQRHFHDFLAYCREELFVENNVELNHVDKIEQEYHRRQPIWWYTSDCFLYSMLNRALRTMDMDLIMNMGFFIRDLHQQIVELHSEQYAGQNRLNSFTVYRGQGMSQMDFDQLKETQGGLMLFNNFILTTFDRASSLTFAESNQDDPDLVGVIFEITINLSTSSTSFANIRDDSYYQNEEKMLFSMHSAFRIGQIKQLEKTNNGLWQVNLTLTNNNNLQLQDLTEYIRKETESSQKGWYRLGKLLIKLGKFYRAQQVFDIMLEQTTDENEKAKLYDALGLVSHNQGKHQEAIEYYERCIEIYQKIRSPIDIDLAAAYNSIGTVYNSISEYSDALSYYEKAFEIYQKALPADHLDLANTHNNFGEVYNNMGKHSESLSHYEQALEIKQKIFSSNHSDIASCYNNMGSVYNAMGEYSKALTFHKKALEIRQKSLSSNHTDLATSYKNMGEVYNNMQEYSEALLYYGKALEIEQKIVPLYHSSLADTYNSIGGIYDELNEHSKALLNYEKALEIFQEILPPNHPSFAISYNNIAGIYNAMHDYLQALLYYRKALEISHKTLPTNHPYFAPLYGHIGMVYVQIEDHPTALVYYERALELSEQSLPLNHPHLKLYKDGIEYIKQNL